jgi:hypothetical protein
MRLQPSPATLGSHSTTLHSFILNRRCSNVWTTFFQNWNVSNSTRRRKTGQHSTARSNFTNPTSDKSLNFFKIFWQAFHTYLNDNDDSGTWPRSSQQPPLSRCPRTTRCRSQNSKPPSKPKNTKLIFSLTSSSSMSNTCINWIK